MNNNTGSSWTDKMTVSYLLEHLQGITVFSRNVAFENFLILQLKIEEKLKEIITGKKFKKIFNGKIVKKIEDNTGKNFIEEIAKPQISIDDFLSQCPPYDAGPYWSKLKQVADRRCLLVPLYALAANLSSYEDAVRSLANELNIEYGNIADVKVPDGYDGETKLPIDEHKFYDAENKIIFNVATFKICNQYVLLPLANKVFSVPPESDTPLLNINLIDYNKDAVIFLTESLFLSQKMQNGCAQEFRLQRLNIQEDFWNNEIEKYNVTQTEGCDANQQELLNLYLRFSNEIKETVSKLKNNGKWNYFEMVSNHVYRYTDIVWSSFYQFDTVDFSPLKGRTIFFVQYGEVKEQILLKNLLMTYSKLRLIDNIQLKFIYIPKITDLLNKENNPVQVMSPQDLLFAAFESGIEIPEDLKDELSEILNKKGKNKNEEFLIWPIIGRKALVLLSGGTGCGKSFQGLTLGYALANKGKLYNNWIVKKACKVLYLCDDELDDDTLKKRKAIFSRIYGDNEESSNITIKTVNGFDLLIEDNQQIIEDLLRDCQLNTGEKGQPVRLLILDHLTKLAPAATQQTNWNNLRPFFSKLKKANISILLLHHLGKTGSLLGSSFIENDAAARIHLEKIDDARDLIIDITVPKNTREKDQPIPYRIKLATGKHPHWIANNSESNLNWKTMSKEDKIIKITELRKDKTMPEIADMFGKHLNTLEKFAGKHGLTQKRNL